MNEIWSLVSELDQTTITSTHHGRLARWRKRRACDVREAKEGFGEWAVTQFILQPFRRFTYVTAHFPTLPLLHLRPNSFSNLSFASPTSQDFHVRHLASRPCCFDVFVVTRIVVRMETKVVYLQPTFVNANYLSPEMKYDITALSFLIFKILKWICTNSVTSFSFWMKESTRTFARKMLE